MSAAPSTRPFEQVPVEQALGQVVQHLVGVVSPELHGAPHVGIVEAGEAAQNLVGKLEGEFYR